MTIQKNAYIEDLQKNHRWKDLSKVQQLLVETYDYSVVAGYTGLVTKSLGHLTSVEEFYKELVAAGISELFYISDSSNYMDCFMAFQRAGAHMSGMATLDNPLYLRGLELYGESFEKPHITAIKWLIGIPSDSDEPSQAKALPASKFINIEKYIKYLTKCKGDFVDDFGKGYNAGINAAIHASQHKGFAANAVSIRHGHWKLKINAHGPDYTGEYWEEPCLVCSECGREEPIEFNILFAKEDELEAKAATLPYCHCGAKMDGGVEYDCD